jgi:putative SOS response-associated peptidase YedK
MTLTRSGSEIAEYFALAMAEDSPTELDGAPLRPRYNIAPSQLIATIQHSAVGSNALSWRQWGLVPSWSKDPRMGGRLFNARSETAFEKPSFRSAWKRRRCLVVADGFYEWTPRNRDHQPYHFRPADDLLLALAGLHEQWQGEGGEIIDSCTVLTTAASADLEGVHHRMPVILAAENFEAWLSLDSDPDDLRGLMRSAPQGTLVKQAVGRAVNSPRNDDPGCLSPVSDSPDQESSPPKSTTKLRPEVEAPSDQGELFGVGSEHSK